jgi:pimeloyl-ACP methyl ester carboxylesterase
VNDRLWHFAFNRLGGLNEQLVHGRERLFFGHQFATRAASPTALPEHAVDLYVQALTASPEALRSSFEFYRALDVTIGQNRARAQRRLELPVLTIAGAQCSGELVGDTMRLAADDVESLILPDCGHYPAEEAPGAMLAALTPFLAPYWRSR